MAFAKRAAFAAVLLASGPPAHADPARDAVLRAGPPETTAVIAFPAGEGTVTDDERAKIIAFAGALSREARDHPVIIASWSDRPFPTGAAPLPKADRDLAALRAKRVIDVLRDSGVVRFESYTMTEHAGWLQETFATRSAEVKGEARAAWLTNAERAALGDRARALGGSGRTVIVGWAPTPSVAH
jgi:hypothetical protein